MRSSISAQSWASVPPAPAWTSRKQSLASASPDSRLSSCSRPSRARSAAQRRLGLGQRSPSSSASASSARSTPSSSSLLQRRCARSRRPAGCARASPPGRARHRSRARGPPRPRSARPGGATAWSQSKMPPQQGQTLLDLLRDMRRLGSHGDLLRCPGGVPAGRLARPRRSGNPWLSRARRCSDYRSAPVPAPTGRSGASCCGMALDAARATFVAR